MENVMQKATQAAAEEMCERHKITPYRMQEMMKAHGKMINIAIGAASSFDIFQSYRTALEISEMVTDTLRKICEWQNE